MAHTIGTVVVRLKLVGIGGKLRCKILAFIAKLFNITLEVHNG